VNYDNTPHDPLLLAMHFRRGLSLPIATRLYLLKRNRELFISGQAAYNGDVPNRRQTSDQCWKEPCSRTRAVLSAWVCTNARFSSIIFSAATRDYGNHQAGYCVNAGLETLLEWMQEAHFGDDEISTILRSLRTSTAQRRCSTMTSWLAAAQWRLRAASRLRTIPEGRVCPPHMCR
jgi:hypothetical protein